MRHCVYGLPKWTTSSRSNWGSTTSISSPPQFLSPPRLSCWVSDFWEEPVCCGLQRLAKGLISGAVCAEGKGSRNFLDRSEIEVGRVCRQDCRVEAETATAP